MEIKYDRRNLAADRVSKRIGDLMAVSAILMVGFAALYGHMWSLTEEIRISTCR